jgi:hypothetical protein
VRVVRGRYGLELEMGLFTGSRYGFVDIYPSTRLSSAHLFLCSFEPGEIGVKHWAKVVGNGIHFFACFSLTRT